MDQSKLKLFIPKEQIAAKVKEAALQISKDYQGKDLVIVMVLKGSLCFVADLIREINLLLEVQTVQCFSYGALGKERGKLSIAGLDRLQIQNRDVLIVDDIFDSGHTLMKLKESLQEQKPSSIQTCVLLHKQGVSRVVDFRPEYVLFDIQNRFVVGYGLDYKEQYRGLPDLWTLEP
jgi:hypoxanthine phosphoribosyltransferase